MNLISNLIWKYKPKSDLYEDYWQDIDTKINDNLYKSQKHFERLDISQQIKFISIFNKNKDCFNRNILLNDFENYFDSFYSGLNRDIINDFYVSRKNQPWTDVDDLLNEFKQHVSFKDYSDNSYEDYFDIMYAIEQIASDKEYFEAYLYSTAVLRYLKNDIYKESPKQKDL